MKNVYLSDIMTLLVYVTDFAYNVSISMLLLGKKWYIQYFYLSVNYSH